MKSSTHVVQTEDKSKVKIVTARDGRTLSSLPRSVRSKAKKAIEKDLSTPVWAKADRDPETMRQQAHIVANSRRRNKPTRASERRQAVDKSLQS